MLSDQADNLLVSLAHAKARRQIAIPSGFTVEVSAVGARLMHGRLRRQPARPLARRPLALVPGVTGGQAGPLRCACSPRSSCHDPRRIGLVAA
ncbi:unnamed protein product [Euphydryas editha]|uniref:Uncharacterized protein n=1 Tax=Euphydryas editha TaxID=104508 RepID=A0AAU9VEF3_EUPED|nr:unnamed protein product [Euphydryas editha]